MLSNHDQVPRHQGQRSASKAPISSHPAFPAIVALWFAVLLGVGSLIVPVVLFERLIAITGLDALVPSAQAPLGFTARMIIALAATGIGIVTGLLLARKTASAQSDLDKSAMPTAKLPISALEELGAQSLDHPVDEDGPVGPDAEPDSGPDSGPDVDPVTGWRPSLWTTGEPDSDEPDGAEMLGGNSQSPENSEPETADEPEVEAQVEAPVEAQVEVHVEDQADSAPSPEIAAKPLHVTEPAESAPEPVAPAEYGMTAEQLITRPLEELGIVQLVERFALSLQQQPKAVSSKEALAQSDSVAEYDATDDDLGPVQQSFEPAISAIPDALRPIEYGDELSGSYDDDYAEEDDLGPLDWRTAFAGSIQSAADNEASELDPELEDDSAEGEIGDLDAGEDYSSLLNLKRNGTEPRKSVHLPDGRVNEAAEPVAVFPRPESDPGQRRFDGPVAVPTADAPSVTRTSSAATERTLRDALEKLEKMSGTG